MKTRSIKVTGIAEADQLTAELAVRFRDGGRSESQAYEMATEVRDRYRAAFSDWQPEVVPTVWISTTSHRSREKLCRAVDDPGYEYGVWGKRGPRGAYYEVPAASVPDLLRIKGITVLRGKPAGELFRRWGQES